MSEIQRCPHCGKNIVLPAYEGDGAYPVPPMCECPDQQPNPRPCPEVRPGA